MMTDPRRPKYGGRGPGADDSISPRRVPVRGKYGKYVRRLPDIEEEHELSSLSPSRSMAAGGRRAPQLNKPLPEKPLPEKPLPEKPLPETPRSETPWTRPPLKPETWDKKKKVKYAIDQTIKGVETVGYFVDSFTHSHWPKEVQDIPVARSKFLVDIAKGADVVNKSADLPDARLSKVARTIKPNPYYLANLHGDVHDAAIALPSPKCEHYFRRRKCVKFAGALVSAVGHFTPIGVNAPGLLRHGSSVGYTVKHLVGLTQILKRLPNCGGLRQNVNVVVAAKWTKLLSKSGQAASQTLGVLDPILLWVKAVVNWVPAVAGDHYMIVRADEHTRAAAELHWRALNEVWMRAPGMEPMLCPDCGSTRCYQGSPATAVIRELFRVVNHTVVSSYGQWLGLNKHDGDAYIAEPAGWMVIKDKLNLI